MIYTVSSPIEARNDAGAHTKVHHDANQTKKDETVTNKHTDIPCNDRLAQFKTQNLDSKFVLTYTRKLLSGASHREKRTIENEYV